MNRNKIMYIFIAILFFSNIYLIIKIQMIKYNEANLISELRNKIEGFIYQPLIVTKSDTIKVGEDYIASIFIGCINENVLPDVYINDSAGHKEWKLTKTTDTLEYNYSYQSYIYINTPLETGVYYWNGIIVHDHLFAKDTLYFHVEYCVE